MKRLITILMLAALTQSIFAQQEQSLVFTSLDWNEMQIDSVLPVYTEVVPLETDYRTHTYTVSLLYPEYAALTAKEAQVAERFDSLLSETIDVETFVGVERKKGLLDISFIPIRRQGARYEKLISAQIVINAKLNGRLNAPRAKAEGEERYAANSKLASGQWVKVSIKEDGLYQFSRASLKKMGFSNPDNVHLYGYGGHLLPELISEGTHYDDLVEVPLYYNRQTDSWIFWGNGLVYWTGDTRVSNTFARQACYFLTQEDSPSTMETLGYDPSLTRSEVNTTRAHTLHEKDEFAWHPIGRHLFDNENYANSNSHTYSISAIDPVGSGKLTVVFTGSDASTNTVAVTINGTSAGSFTVQPPGDYVYATASTRNYDLTSIGTPASLSVNLRSDAGKKAHLDYIAYNYNRKLSTTAKGFVDFSLSGSSSGPTRFSITGSNTKVIRTGSVGVKDALVEGTQGDTYTIDVDNGGQHFVAFNTAASFPEPTVVGNVENQNLHSLDSLDMVIIIPTSGKLRSEAQRLADAHLQYDGLRVAIVRADQVYNEFSSGTPDPTAYRLFMKMLYDRAASDDVAPRYLLLFGDCAWDNRMYSSAWRNSNPDDYLLCYESENSFSDTKSYIMEDYFGLLDDGEGFNTINEKGDIGIGRFPVSQLSAAKIMVDKCITYMSHRNAGPWKNLVYFMGDDGDENEHMKYANRVAEDIITKFPDVEVHKIMWDAYTRVSSTNSNTYPEAAKQIKKQMADGALVMNYTGHAAAYGFSHEFVLLREDFETNKSTRLPLWVTCACDVMPFDSYASNIGETAVLNPNGGALAFYGTTRTVFASQNYNMNHYFMQYLFARNATYGGRNRIGDAIRMAKNSIISDGRQAGYLENKLQYALLGDPALTMGNPLHKVVVDRINDKEVDGTPIPLKAGERVKLSGHVEKSDGTTMTDFNGIVYTRLFDSKDTIVCLNNAGAEVPYTFTDRNGLLHESQDSVRAGLFDEEFIVPVDINFSNEDGRFVFYGIDTAQGIEANGYNEDIPLGGMVENTDFDKDGPEIFAYLNDEDFQDGDKVNATPLFVAQLTDASGISSSGNGIGHDLSLCIDGRSELTYNINEYYTHEFGDFTRGTVAYNIPQLNNGSHSLTFRAWDVLNNTSQTSFNFVVDDGMTTNILRLMATQNPAVTSTNFMVSYDLPGSECDFVIEVFDFSGRCVWRHEETTTGEGGIYTVTWNLTNGVGAKVDTGIYLYRCRVRCGQSNWTSKTQKIMVRNNK